MNSRYGLGMEGSTDAPSQRYDLSFFEAIFQNNIEEFGRANQYSKEENIWRINEPGMRWACYETNLLGDPHLSVNKPQVTVTITTPDTGLYLFGQGPIFPLPLPVIIGDITVTATTSSESIEGISFYVDDTLMHTAYATPYEWRWESRAIGRHRIRAEAFTADGQNTRQELDVLIFNL
jgi:hypothetical protein